MTTFTIIVPVYKVEKYIASCLQSILEQTYSDFEVICVDDCGGDDSINIVEEFAQKDSRIKILYQPHNKGVAAARNLALQKAQGKYIFNVDSDDWIEKDTLQILKSAFEQSGSSSVWFDGYHYFENTQTRAENPIINTIDGFRTLTPENLASFPDMCGMKAYVTQSIKDIGLNWPEDIKFDEDGEFYFKYYSHYKQVYSISDCLYYLRRHEESAVANFNAGKTSCRDLFQVLKNVKNFYVQRGIYDEYKVTLLKLIQNRINMCKNSSYSNDNKKLALDLLKTLNFPEDFQKFNSDKTPLVSIVVPFYNVEKYIEHCLCSIMSQTYKNIEILCIDDCGQDNSTNIVKRLAKEDARIKLIKHKKNKGLGGARNTGLKKASGEYVLFIDSDDWITDDCVSSVVGKMNLTGVNSAWFKADYWLDEEQRKAPMDFCSYFMNMNEGYLWLDGSNISSFPVVTWNKAYRTDFLKNNKLGWRENIIYEDVEFYWHMFTQSPQIYIIDKHLYYYRQRAGSIMQDQTKVLEKAKTAFFVVSEVAEYLKKNSLFEKYKQVFWGYVENVFCLFKGDIESLKEYKLAKLDFLKKIGE